MDVFAQGNDIKRRQELLAQMLQQSQDAPITGQYGLGQALAKLGTAYLTKQGQQSLTDQASANQGEYQKQLAAELGTFQNRFQGTPGNEMDNPTEGDPVMALQQAMASRFPEMRAMGQAGLPATIAQAAKGPKAPAYKEHMAPDGTLLRTTEGKPGAEVLGRYAKPKDEWTEPFDLQADGRTIKAIRNKTTGETKAVGSGGTTVSLNTGDRMALKNFIEAASPGGKSFDSAKAARESMTIGLEQVKAINEGAKTGSLGAVQQELRKFGELLNVPNSATAPTEVLGNLAMQKVLAKLGGLGVGISSTDRDFLFKAQGDLSTQPQALKRLLALSLAGDIRALDQHGQVVAGLQGEVPEGLRNAMRININTKIDDPEVAKMVENVLAGRATTDGMAVQPAASGLRPQQTPTRVPWGK